VAAAVLAVALPDDREIAGRVGGGRRAALASSGKRVDTEFAALEGARGAVALGVDAVAGAVLGGALPGDHEIAGPAHRHRGRGLRAGRERVGAELYTLGDAAGAEALRVDAGAVAVLGGALPGNGEVAGLVDRHCRRALVSGDEGVGAEFSARGRARGAEALGV